MLSAPEVHVPRSPGPGAPCPELAGCKGKEKGGEFPPPVAVSVLGSSLVCWEMP